MHFIESILFNFNTFELAYNIDFNLILDIHFENSLSFTWIANNKNFRLFFSLSRISNLMYKQFIYEVKCWISTPHNLDRWKIFTKKFMSRNICFIIHVHFSFNPNSILFVWAKFKQFDIICENIACCLWFFFVEPSYYTMRWTVKIFFTAGTNFTESNDATKIFNYKKHHSNVSNV